MRRILVGTSSWTDKSLVDSGKFYPPWCRSAEQRLRYYADRFAIVQNDAAWYALPATRVVEDWVKRTPADFVFDVKLFRLFTLHQTPIAAIPPDLRGLLPEVSERGNVYLQDVPDEVQAEVWRRYREALEPLRQAGKLGVVTVQLAPWIGPSRQTLHHLTQVREQLADWPLAVEFRNPAWYGERQERTFALLRDYRLAHVVPDAPQGVPFSVPLVPVVTWPPVSVLRLHGRNKETWTQKGLKSSAQRFNYEYSREELRGLAGVAAQLAGEAQDVHLMVNVNYQDQGQRAARALQELLWEAGLGPQPPRPDASSSADASRTSGPGDGAPKSP